MVGAKVQASAVLGAALAWLLIGGPAEAAAQQPDNSVCAGCHDIAAKLQPGKPGAPAHSAVACSTCHEKHDDYPHPKGIEKPQCANCHDEQARDFGGGVHGRAAAAGKAAPDCGVCHGSAHELLKPSSADFRKGVPETCGMCHDGVAKEYQASVHGKALRDGVAQAPICNDCHGEHKIEPPQSAASSVHPSHVRDTCARCHGDLRLSQRFGLPPDRVTSFDASFHGLAAKSGSQTVANCASCHGVHNILPTVDPKSTVNPRNLPATCGRCHPGAGSRFALGTIHQSEGGREPAGVSWVRAFYLALIPGVIGLMLLHNLGDWIRKLYRLRIRPVPLPPLPAAAAGSTRMYPLERAQHAMLAVSFIVLAWSGFALKYPNEWWARPLLFWETGIFARGVVHRAAAVVFVLVSLAHAVLLALNPRLRQHWLELIPKPRDAREALQMLGWSLGIRKHRPVLSSHSYIEKAEYWAVVWGAVVMALSGILLWANTWALAWLPKSWLDVFTAVHFYEAVLATLAIFVWHFYFVLFDPEVYPMDPAWLTGYSVRKRPLEGPDEPSS